MSGIRNKYDTEFRKGAVRLVAQTRKSIAAIARDLGVNEGTLGNWVSRDPAAGEGTEGLSNGDIEELRRLRSENTELRLERDVLKRSVILPVLDAGK
jgi:transposase